MIAGKRSTQPPRLTRLLDLLNANPDLAPHVRSLTLEWSGQHKEPVWDTVPLETATLRSDPPSLATPRAPSERPLLRHSEIVGGEFALADALVEHGMHESLNELELDTHYLG
ncbi:hypothetical protein C8Q76DRAFT_791303 [Earliella scabrosa]|nr:hypothetical protein C8Q76DRAFT_791303 [Earliella scabrosa]